MMNHKDLFFLCCEVVLVLRIINSMLANCRKLSELCLVKDVSRIPN